MQHHVSRSEGQWDGIKCLHHQFQDCICSLTTWHLLDMVVKQIIPIKNLPSSISRQRCNASKCSKVSVNLRGPSIAYWWKNNNCKQGTNIEHQLDDGREVSRSRNRISKSRSVVQILISRQGQIWFGYMITTCLGVIYHTTLQAQTSSSLSTTTRIPFESSPSIAKLCKDQKSWAFSTTRKFPAKYSMLIVYSRRHGNMVWSVNP